MTERAKEIVNMSAGTLIHLGLILSTIVLSFAVVKGQASGNTEKISTHMVTDEKKWDKVHGDIETLKRIQTEIRISQKEQATHYIHILSEIQEVKGMFKQFEVID